MRSCLSRLLGWGSLAAIVLTGLGLSLACSTPTLPLPPPAALTYEGPDAEGFVTISGEAEPGAYVHCFNRDRDAGVIVRANALGLFTARVAALPGDTIEVWQDTGTERGLTAEIMVMGAAPPDGGM